MPGIVWIWLAAVVVFLIVELVTPSFFFICFSAGAVFGGVVAWIWPEAYYWQLAVFALSTLALIPVARIFARRISGDQQSQTNVDALIGKVGLVMKPITPTASGQVKIGGDVWGAFADESIDADRQIVVLEVTGAKLRVKAHRPEKE